MTAAVQTPGFVESVKDEIVGTKVLVFCNAGTFPLEWPKHPDGTRMVDDNDIAMMGNKAVITNRRRYRNIDTRMVDERGVGGQSQGYEELNLNDKSHPLESDADFLARIEDFLANSNDPRIETYGVRVEKVKPYPVPFARWDVMNPADALKALVDTQLGDDHEANLKVLKSAVGYELNREDGPRQAILDGLDAIARAGGDESFDEVEIIDETALD